MGVPPSSLEELVAPLLVAEFLSLLRERKLTLLRGTESDRYKSLLNWDALLGMIARGEHPTNLSEFRLTRDSVMVPPERWLTRSKTGNGNVVDPARIQAYMDQGFNLVVTRIDAHAAHLVALCDSIRSQLFEQIKIGVVVTTGKYGAYSLHYDPEDLIILQVEGSKRWKIYGPPVSNPVAGMPVQQLPPEEKPIFDEVLQSGDFLFVPRGNWHRCENGPGRSLHLGVFFQPPTAWNFVKAFNAQLLSDETFRLPLTRRHDAADLSALEADIKSRAIDNINRLKLTDFFADWIKAPGS